MKYTQAASVIALLTNPVSSSATADDSFTADLAGCLSFAAAFDNTCTDLKTPPAFTAIPKKSMSCPTSTVGTCAGTTTGDNCIWNRQLCVTCQKVGDVVRIRTQSNNLPNHCYSSPKTAPAAMTVDYESVWMPTTAMNAQSDVGEDQDDLDSLICNIKRSSDANIPKASAFKNNGDKIMTAWGVSTSGILMFNGLSGEGSDPFYPRVWGKVTDDNIGNATERTDDCLGHPQVQGIYHYHSASTCIADPTIVANASFSARMKNGGGDRQKGGANGGQRPQGGGAKGGQRPQGGGQGKPQGGGSGNRPGSGNRKKQDGDGDHHGGPKSKAKSQMETAWKKVPFRTALGISKDGIPVYTPLHGDGKAYDFCEVDICNGMMINGQYSYVSTFFHPYIIGCYGQGSSAKLAQACSSNPRNCGNVYKSATSLMMSGVAAAATAFILMA